MNTVGKVFLVLCLPATGAHVFFAGTYLQRAHNYKGLYVKEQADRKTEVESLSAQVQTQTSKVAERERELSGVTSQRNSFQNQLDEKNRENDRLQKRLVEMEGAVKKTESYMAKVDGAIDTAVKDSKNAMEKAIAAAQARDDAVAAMNQKQGELDDANHKIKNLEKDVADKSGNIAKLDQTIREDKVLLDIVNTRYPGIFETIHPLVTGTVTNVGASGNMVTIALESGADRLKSGARFAIFNQADGYKGEATVSEVESSGKFAFAKLTLKAGPQIAKGDSASTNLSSSGK